MNSLKKNRVIEKPKRMAGPIVKGIEKNKLEVVAV